MSLRSCMEPPPVPSGEPSRKRSATSSSVAPEPKKPRADDTTAGNAEDSLSDDQAEPTPEKRNKGKNKKKNRQLANAKGARDLDRAVQASREIRPVLGLASDTDRLVKVIDLEESRSSWQEEALIEATAHYDIGDIDSESYTVIRGGMGVAIRRRDALEGEDPDNVEYVVAFSWKFTPWEGMDPEVKTNFYNTAETFYILPQAFHHVSTNAAHERGGEHGEMFAVGWRKGYSQLSFGHYHPKRFRDLIPWMAVLSEIRNIAAFYHERRNAMGSTLATKSQEAMSKAGAPDLAKLNWKPEEKPVTAASNLTVTHGDFANAPHRDKDLKGTSTYGYWFQTKDGPLENGSPTMGSFVENPEEAETVCEGGRFLFPRYRYAINFGYPGVVEVIWVGAQEWHATERSSTTPGFRRWGTSVQTAQKLHNAREAGSKKDHGSFAHHAQRMAIFSDLDTNDQETIAQFNNDMAALEAEMGKTTLDSLAS